MTFILYVVVFVASVMIAISPVFIWNEVQKIRMLSEDSAKKMDETIATVKKCQGALERSASSLAALAQNKQAPAPRPVPPSTSLQSSTGDRRVIEISGPSS